MAEESITDGAIDLSGGLSEDEIRLCLARHWARAVYCYALNDPWRDVVSACAAVVLALPELSDARALIAQRAEKGGAAWVAVLSELDQVIGGGLTLDAAEWPWSLIRARAQRQLEEAGAGQ